VSALRDSLNRLFAFLADERIEIPTEQVWILELRSNVALDERGRLRVSRAELQRVDGMSASCSRWSKPHTRVRDF